MKKFCKIYHDGSNYIVKLGGGNSRPHGPLGSKKEDKIYEMFKTFYAEAVSGYIPKRERFEYITNRFIDNVENVLDIPTVDELEVMFRRHVTNLYKRIRRYKEKAFLNDWNWWVTFTYDDKKMTEEQFRRRIRTKLSNLSSKNGWRYMMRWEEGEIGERLHLHAFLFIPEGEMIGELFCDHHYSTKRHRQEFFTNNTYFSNMFGVSDWKSISNLKNNRSLLNYLIKYMIKEDGKIMYSRGIPNEYEFELDLEEDITVIFNKGGFLHAVLNPFFFNTEEEEAELTKNFYVFEYKNILSLYKEYEQAVKDELFYCIPKCVREEYERYLVV